MDNERTKISFRKNEIASGFIKILDQHVTELAAGTVENAMEIKEIADLMFIDPNHLSDTIAEVLGKSPCTIYEEMLLAVSKELLAKPTMSITEIARRLDYDPSNFTKFFKRFTGMTPKAYRQIKSEKLTI